MPVMPPITELADEHDFAAVFKRFVALNETRLARTREALRPRQRDFLDLLPLFFHLNHPLFPGYSAHCPVGIQGYLPEPAALEAAQRLCRGFQLQRQRLHRVMQIQAIYLMGSPGSVAYTGDSDFDIWLCHRPDLDTDGLSLLREKARAVETWAASMELEVHIFLVHPDQFRRGESEALSSESSGTAQLRLLLDEFYRTGVRLAGMYPVWWLVPPSHETDYERFVEDLRRQRYIHARDLIDFGGISHVPAEEFLGAAVWQLYKGIDSPYKSVLKLLLIESYARGYPYLNLLSLRFKQAVYEGEIETDRLDPYLMMLDRVEEYLTGLGEQGRLELARRCFYLKVREKLSDDLVMTSWRRATLQGRVHTWGWTRGDLLHLDGHGHWKVERVTEERRKLFDALSESYRFLSGFARRYSGAALISQRDLTILGRKLYAAFERKAGKMELFGSGLGGDLVEEQLSVHEVIEDTHAASLWVLYRGVVRPEDLGDQTPLKKFRHIIEVVAWCYFNRLVERHTQVVVYARQSHLTTVELRAMIGRMYTAFPERAECHGDVSDYAEPAQVARSAFFVNAGVDPLSRGETQDGRIASGRSDALSFGGLNENLVLSIDQVVFTTWREVLTSHFYGATGLMGCLCDYLKWFPLSSPNVPPVPAAASYSPAKGQMVARRVEELFRSVIDCYYVARRSIATRYVLKIGQGYGVLWFEGDLAQYQLLESQTALLRYLGSAQKEFSPVVFDGQMQGDPILPILFEHNRAGIVQLFYRVAGNQVDIYVLDERGSLHFRRSPFYNPDALIGQYSHFFEAVLNRVNFLMQDGRDVRAADGLEFYALENDNGHLRPVRKLPRFAGVGTQFISLQAIVDVDETGRISLTFYCNGREFTTPENGGRVFDEIVRYVVDLRRSGQPYPVYVTDISLAAAVLAQQHIERIQTIHFLKYKHRIEEKLEEALNNLRG